VISLGFWLLAPYPAVLWLYCTLLTQKVGNGCMGVYLCPWAEARSGTLCYRSMYDRLVLI